jgi:hypothetical protein
MLSACLSREFEMSDTKRLKDLHQVARDLTQHSHVTHSSSEFHSPHQMLGDAYNSMFVFMSMGASRTENARNDEQLANTRDGVKFIFQQIL